VRRVSALERTCCPQVVLQLLMNAEVRFGASCIWSIATLPMFTLPTAAELVVPESMPEGPTGTHKAVPSSPSLQRGPGDEGDADAR